jgi:Nucleotidyl transferase of unknown function (DUF2204)
MAKPRSSVLTRRAPASVFYHHIIETLTAAGIPFLVGGTYALNYYTGIVRRTKDLDIFLQRHWLERTLSAIRAMGYRTEITHPHFLGKAFDGQTFIDVIFSSGNGSMNVDDWWFAHAPEGRLFGLTVRFSPIEEMIWSKAFVMERERYDGHDVIHLIRAGQSRIDWDRLVQRFGNNWRVLLSYLILFGYVYPGERDAVPARVLDELVARLRDEPRPAEGARLCRGTLLSRSQYLHDVEDLGLDDARLAPFGTMSPEHMKLWTNAIEDDERANRATPITTRRSKTRRAS